MTILLGPDIGLVFHPKLAAGPRSWTHMGMWQMWWVTGKPPQQHSMYRRRTKPGPGINRR